MAITGDDLGPARPVSDERLLLAIGRASDHSRRDRRAVHPKDIAEHLGFLHSPATTRRLRPRIEAFEAAGLLMRDPRKTWQLKRLTAKGRRRVAALRKRGDEEPLPESPRHRSWREAVNSASRHFDEILAALGRDLAEAQKIPDARPADVLAGRFSATQLSALGERLRADLGVLALAVHLLLEDGWPEPDDARSDPGQGPGWPLTALDELDRGAAL